MPDWDYDPATITVVITEDVAKFSSRFNCTACPIATAINRHLDEEFHSIISPYRGYLQRWAHNGGASYDYDFDLPDAAKRFIRNFDGQEFIQFPVQFQLEIPRRFLKEQA